MDDEFCQEWIARFSRSLKMSAGEEVRSRIMEEVRGIPPGASEEEAIVWVRGAMSLLADLVDETTCRRVMTGCACRYPVEDLREIREAYEASKDRAVAHRMLQARLESFLRDTLELDEETAGEVIRRGWGLAGILKDCSIIATKIPKSGNLVAYLSETDPVKKRGFYCHCPLVGSVAREDGRMPRSYCYCGAGFYQGIWEEITGAPVEVEVLETVLDGGEVCRFAIHLSEE